MENIRRNYYTDGSIYSETFFIDYQVHRENSPAIVYYYENGDISRIYYYLNGELHRENGPAIIWYNQDRNIELEYYFINGIQIKDEFKIMVMKGLNNDFLNV